MAFKGEIKESELEDLASSKLRLFMSVDVVGSTAFKHHTERSDAQGWLDLFTSFYTEFPQFLVKAREELIESDRLPLNHLPQAPVWKALGDELIFVTELTHRKQAELHLTSFRRALNRAVTHFVHGRYSLPINFKATAWLAGFPVGNAAVLTDDGDGQVPYDFVGPAIDIGFRLAKYATPRRFVVSVELAYLILVAQGRTPKFFYDGKESLPGVLNDRGYPIIWIDSYDGVHRDDTHHEHKLTASEDALLVREPRNPDHLRDFSRAYIEDIGQPLILPFIAEDVDEVLPIPEGYEKKRAEVEKRLRGVFTVIGDNPEGSPASTDDPIEELEEWEPNPDGGGGSAA